WATLPARLSLHDALPILPETYLAAEELLVLAQRRLRLVANLQPARSPGLAEQTAQAAVHHSQTQFQQLSPIDVLAQVEAVTQLRSEEHTSELQSRENLVC